MTLTEVPLDFILQIILDDLPDMVKQKDNTSKFVIKGSRDSEDEVLVKIELEPNPLKDNYLDASIVIDGLAYTAKDVEHEVKLSIYSRQCLNGENLNKNAPDKELEIESIMPRGNSESILTFPEIANIEQELSSNVCSIWNSLMD